MLGIFYFVVSVESITVEVDLLQLVDYPCRKNSPLNVFQRLVGKLYRYGCVVVSMLRFCAFEDNSVFLVIIHKSHLFKSEQSAFYCLGVYASEIV